MSYLKPGINDMKTLFPELARQWHPTKNGDLSPEACTAYSNKKVWWICEKGHEWETLICHRTRGRGCPYCCGLKVIPNCTDLATTHPQLAQEWHPTKNGDLKPDMVSHGSHKKVWWQCPQGHAWQAIVYNRSTGSGCPICCNKAPDCSTNNRLSVKLPLLAAQWHPTKNGDLTPDDVTYKSGRIVWWQCENGHEWQKRIAFRANYPSCPICYHQRAQRRKQKTE